MTKKVLITIPALFLIVATFGLFSFIQKNNSVQRNFENRLEQDIERYQNIKKASIVFDKTKASVLLTLNTNKKPHPQEIRSIVFHIASAANDLDPNNIAISDTHGHIYHPKNSEKSIKAQNIKNKIDTFLSSLLGSTNFFSDISLSFGDDFFPKDSELAEFMEIKDEEEPVKKILPTIVINQNILKSENWNRQQLKTDIEKKLTNLLNQYNAVINSDIAFVPFVASSIKTTSSNSVENTTFPITYILLIALVIQGVYWLFILFMWQRPKNRNDSASSFYETLNHIKIRIDHDPEQSAKVVRNWLNEQKIHN